MFKFFFCISHLLIVALLAYLAHRISQEGDVLVASLLASFAFLLLAALSAFVCVVRTQ